MNENDYLQRLAPLTGLQHYPKQGPWARKSGSAIGSRDGYVITIGTMRERQGMKIAILLRFKKMEQTQAVKSALKSAGIKKGKLGAVGNDFVRWEWKYSFAKPKPEEVAKLAEDLRTALKTVATAFDGRCEHCASASTPSLTLMNGLPTFICAGCQETVRQELNMAAANYDAITPNYPNGLVPRYRRGCRGWACLGPGGLCDRLYFSLWRNSHRLFGCCGRAERHRKSDPVRTNHYSGSDGRKRVAWRRDFLHADRNEA
jgi:hypothetical protein